MEIEPILWTGEQAAKYLGMSPETLRKLAAAGKVPFFPPHGIGRRGKRYIKAQLDQWIARGSVNIR